MFAMEQYSASIEERERVACFFDFHDTRELPRKIQKPVTNLLESKQAAQSKFENAFNWML